MGALVHALRSKQKSLDSDEVAALRVFTGAAATRPNSTVGRDIPAIRATNGTALRVRAQVRASYFTLFSFFKSSISFGNARSN